MTAERDRYEPGDRVTVSVLTRTATGQPTSASVFVRAVDEKLFAMGAANMDDPLGELYASVDSGLIASGWSHGGPLGDEGGGKDTGVAAATTGGGREDFRDWLVARLVTTGEDGRATVSFDLSDDLTSWRIVGSAITTGLQAGVGQVHVPVGLPFFAEVVVAPEYLAVDRPAVRLRAYGSALRAGDPVRFTMTSAPCLSGRSRPMRRLSRRSRWTFRPCRWARTACGSRQQLRGVRRRSPTPSREPSRW